MDLREIANAGVTVELQAGKCYLVFIDQQTVDLPGLLNHCADAANFDDIDMEFIPVKVPLGESLRDVVAIYEKESA